MAASVSGNHCWNWFALSLVAQCRRSGDSDTGAGWGDWKKGSSFVMWKPTGEGDIYRGLVELDAAIVRFLVFVVGIWLVIDSGNPI